jgi:predicted SAM-dependent methyltransferase
MSSLNPRRRYRLLDFAPSSGLRRKLRRTAFFNYRSADLVRRTVDDRVDITDMRIYPDQSFDIFICSHVLEHVADDRKGMRELFRVLKPDGFGIVMVPLIKGVERTDENPDSTGEWRLDHYGDSDHVRQYGIQDFYDRLTETGFHVALLDKAYFGTEAFRKAGLAEDSRLWLVSKP